jgi:hypothetical protein
MNIAAALIATAGLFIYLLPAMIASIREVEHDGAIIAINVIFGWTVLGWIAALIWAVVEKPLAQPEPITTPEHVTVHPDGALTVSHDPRTERRSAA